MNPEKYYEYQKCGDLVDFYHQIIKDYQQTLSYNQFLKFLHSVLETFSNEKRANVFKYYYAYNHSIVWIRYNFGFRSCAAVERMIHAAENEVIKKFTLILSMKNTYDEINK